MWLRTFIVSTFLFGACDGGLQPFTDKGSDTGSDTGHETDGETDGETDSDTDGETSVDQIIDSLSWTPVGDDGWSHYEPHADTQKIYVSQEGEDSRDGLSEGTAVKTIARALQIAQARAENGTVARPDWILFRAGDVWSENFRFRSNTVKGGLSEEYPFILTSYGDGPRPKFVWPESGPLWSYGWYGSGYQTGEDAAAYWSIIGLDFYTATKDPDSPDFDVDRSYPGSNPSGVFVQQGAHHILFEDCKFQYTPLVVQRNWPHHIVVRRSLLLDNYGYHDHAQTNSVYHHAQGFYASEVDSLLLEENLFDHNGWLSAEYDTTAPTIYNHNIYLNSNTTRVVVHGNITARASADGVKARGGGAVLNNLAIGDGIPINMNGYGHDGMETTVQYNVVMKSLNQPLHGAASHSGHLERDWGISYGAIDPALMDVVGNIIAHSPEGRRSVASACRAISACVDGHLVYGWGDDADTVSGVPDPERDLESYLSSIGETPTFDAFLAEARKQSKRNWRPEFTAGAVNNYIREGFGVEMLP